MVPDDQGPLFAGRRGLAERLDQPQVPPLGPVAPVAVFPPVAPGVSAKKSVTVVPG
jgi:hypothetical protein